MSSRRVFLTFLSVCVVLAGLALAGSAVYAASSDLGLSDFAAQGTTLPTDSPAAFAARLIRWIVGILGVLLVALFVYGGILYATSAGNEDRVKTGKSVLLYAVIGTVIVFASLIISDFVLSALSQGQQHVFGPSYAFPQDIQNIDSQIRQDTHQPNAPAQGSNDCFVNDQNQTCCRQASASGYQCYARKAQNAQRCYIDGQQQLCCPGVFGTTSCSK